MATLENDRIDLKLTDANDLKFDSSLRLSWTTGLDAVAQRLKIRMQMFKGEWFLDLDAGVPYWEDILGQKYDEAQVLAAFRGVLVKTRDVVKILSLTSSFDASTRKLKITWHVTTAFGDTEPDSLEVG